MIPLKELELVFRHTDRLRDSQTSKLKKLFIHDLKLPYEFHDISYQAWNFFIDDLEKMKNISIKKGQILKS